jgi:hypothetical protein
LTDKDRIRCSVSSCHYWMQGNYCEASSIMITSDAVPRETHHGIDASAISQLNTPVQQCEETCCKTYISHDDQDEHAVDDVTKIGSQLNQQSQQQSRQGQNSRPRM